MSDLLIPEAIDPAGARCVPERACAGVEYRCPDCRGVVLLRSGGARRRAHFAHRAGACAGGESAAHRAACDAAARVTAGERAFEVACPGCSRLHVVALPRFEQAVREMPLAGGVRADVALMAGDAACLVIEVCHGHALDTSKMERLGTTPWIEVAAAEVLGGQPPWRAMRSRGLGPCPTCLGARVVRVRECWNCGAEVGEGACGGCGVEG